MPSIKRHHAAIVRVKRFFSFIVNSFLRAIEKRVCPQLPLPTLYGRRYTACDISSDLHAFAVWQAILTTRYTIRKGYKEYIKKLAEN
jgi:hypothetical protein